LATSPCISQSVCRFVRIAQLIVVALATFALYNYPRAWWQELICDTALVWVPIFVVGACVQLRRLIRDTLSVFTLVLVILQALCVAKVVEMARPYVYAPSKTYPKLTYSSSTRFAFIDINALGERSSLKARALVEREDPDVVIFARFTEAPLADVLRARYPYVLASSVASDRTVEIVSKAPIRSAVRTEYGYGALPGVFGNFQTPDGVPFQLAAFDLIVSSTQDSFNKSRITARRLASALKYSTEPRIVVGAFRASVTSQLVDMYVDQLKLRSIFFNAGLSQLWRCLVGSLALSRNLNVFTAKNIELESVRELHDESDEFAAILFTVQVPRVPG